jgi:hypothetical protein
VRAEGVEGLGVRFGYICDAICLCRALLTPSVRINLLRKSNQFLELAGEPLLEAIGPSVSQEKVVGPPCLYFGRRDNGPPCRRCSFVGLRSSFGCSHGRPLDGDTENYTSSRESQRLKPPKQSDAVHPDLRRFIDGSPRKRNENDIHDYEGDPDYICDYRRSATRRLPSMRDPTSGQLTPSHPLSTPRATEPM